MMMFVAAVAMMFAACDKDDDNGSGSHSGSAELANTVWTGSAVNTVSGYEFTTNYTFTFGSTNQVSIEMETSGARTVMAGTYDYSGGKGTAYVKYTYRPDDVVDENEYRIKFNINGNTMVAHISTKDVTLTKVQ